MIEIRDDAPAWDDDYPVSIRAYDARRLMDELWELGVRPTSAPPRPTNQDGGELTAVKYHLEDMRKLAFSNPDLCVEVGGPAFKVRL